MATELGSHKQFNFRVPTAMLEAAHKQSEKESTTYSAKLLSMTQTWLNASQSSDASFPQSELRKQRGRILDKMNHLKSLLGEARKNYLNKFVAVDLNAAPIKSERQVDAIFPKLQDHIFAIHGGFTLKPKNGSQPEFIGISSIDLETYCQGLKLKVELDRIEEDILREEKVAAGCIDAPKIEGERKLSEEITAEPQSIQFDPEQEIEEMKTTPSAPRVMSPMEQFVDSIVPE